MQSGHAFERHLCVPAALRFNSSPLVGAIRRERVNAPGSGARANGQALGHRVRSMIDQLAFGRTGHLSSRVIFGAAALSSIDQETADTLLPLLDAYGVNHLDTAASYGEAELRLAPWLVTRRSDFFLATKTGERTGDGARRELERSLSRLGVDSVDLIQLHNLVEPEEFEVAHGPGGAVEALARARDEGLVKAIGVTGHGLAYSPDASCEPRAIRLRLGAVSLQLQAATDRGVPARHR